MIAAEETPIIDYAMRSASEQHGLFEQGKTQCDGFKIISKHQLGKAIDIYLVDQNGNVVFGWDAVKAERWHNRWEELGGKPIIGWDKGHFEA